ncbi:DUF2188 domain-containing protein [Methylobacterium sp. J-048]|uniref:DUF2188 domain-containing protein n=1 Tax=Methylobacterium sp. J-048 TaxID=2836635 RepID=UPI001FB8E0EA|nr:DUF2188 domain-containing protein [Methylobacterium sp. J-048]MCJ2057813.1 DUF2188 domain-containing protein [Methylobacterium sp. J-048]
MGKPSQHVSPSGSRWSLRRAGAAKASKTFETQAEAIAKGREVARKQRTILFIHGPDGRIRERDSYRAESGQPNG